MTYKIEQKFYNITKAIIRVSEEAYNNPIYKDFVYETITKKITVQKKDIDGNPIFFVEKIQAKDQEGNAIELESYNPQLETKEIQEEIRKQDFIIDLPNLTISYEDINNYFSKNPIIEYNGYNLNTIEHTGWLPQFTFIQQIDEKTFETYIKLFLNNQ